MDTTAEGVHGQQPGQALTQEADDGGAVHGRRWGHWGFSMQTPWI
jgi:hypothetical protein